MLERSDPVNWSSLKCLRESPKHYRWALDHPREDSEALLLGRVTHCAVYEPAQLATRYVVAPRFHGGMKDDTAIAAGYDGGKEAKLAWESTSHPEAVSADIYARAIACRDALLSDPIAGPMIHGGFSEQFVTWTDAITGIECHGRVDHVNGCLSDLKTTRSVQPHAFNGDIGRLGYHVQIAYYADGLEANGIMLLEKPAIIAVESNPPHDVVVLEFTEEDMAIGRAVYRRCLDALAIARLTDHWPGVAGGKRQRVDLPAWANPLNHETLTLGGELVSF